LPCVLPSHVPSAPVDGPRTFLVRAGDDADCTHDNLRQLASDGGANRTFRCRSCGGVLVRETPLRSGGSDADLGSVDPRLGEVPEDIDGYHERRRPSLLTA
jgi:hypothetical protein